jgi:hypothetical protein
MAPAVVSDDGWTVVSKKPQVITPKLRRKMHRGISNMSDSSEVICRKVSGQCKAYKLPSYLKEMDFGSMLILGIGSIGSLQTPLLQLVIAQHIVALCDFTHLACYDPVLTQPEKKALNLLGYKFTSDLTLTSIQPGLLFMPHCDKSLYLSILREHRSKLDRLTIIGNDFRVYALRSTGDEGLFWTKICECMSFRGFHLSPNLPLGTLSDTVCMQFLPEDIQTLVDLLS